MATKKQLLSRFDDDNMQALLESAQTIEEIEAIGEIWSEFTEMQLQQAMDDFIKGSIVLLNLIDKLLSQIKSIGHAPNLEVLLKTAEELRAKLHKEEVVPDPDPVDTATPPPPPPPADLDEPSVTSNLDTGEITQQPKTSKSKKFSVLKQEYADFISGAKIRNERRNIVAKLAKVALNNRNRYDAVGQQLGIPWWFIAGIHQMESSYNFNTHLHNGDTLSKRTTHVPKGRPKDGSPPFTWEQSATDALKMKNLHKETNWSVPRALYLWERYNGFGYRTRQIPSPYLWSFTTVYEKGKFVADGVFDHNAVSKQCGTGTLLKYLIEKGHVALVAGTIEDGDAPDFSEDIENAITVPAAPEIPIGQGSGFHQFFAENLSDVRNFRASEFLYKGASHASNGLNTDPPEHLWQNVVPLARLLDAIRREIGQPMKLISVYRSPAYNERIGGASKSQHKEFTAADFTVLAGDGGPRDWAEIADRLQRSNQSWFGGLGIYVNSNFVHVDVRGHLARWNG